MKPCLQAMIVLGLAVLSQTAQARPESTETVTAQWSDASRVTADMLVEEYGPPDEIIPDRLVWDQRGPWKRITLWNALPGSGFGPNILAEMVAYPVAPEERGLLTEFSGNIDVPESGTSLGARSPDEDLNRLTINLAEQILTGAISPTQARELYDKTVQLRASGKGSPLLKRIMFSQRAAPRSRWPIQLRGTPNPDIPSPLWSTSGLDFAR